MSKFAYVCDQMRVAAIIAIWILYIMCILNSRRFYIIRKLKIIKSLFINEEQPFVAFCVNHNLYILVIWMYIYKFIMNAKIYLKFRYLKKKKEQQHQQKLTYYEVWPASCMVAYV